MIRFWSSLCTAVRLTRQGFAEALTSVHGLTALPPGSDRRLTHAPRSRRVHQGSSVAVLAMPCPIRIHIIAAHLTRVNMRTHRAPVPTESLLPPAPDKYRMDDIIRRPVSAAPLCHRNSRDLVQHKNSVSNHDPSRPHLIQAALRQPSHVQLDLAQQGSEV